MRGAAPPRHDPGRAGRWAGAAGLAVAAVHAAGFAALAGRCRGPELAVTLAGGEPAVPAALAGRVEAAIDGEAPGLVRRTWTVRYRGGFARTVGVAELVGPFQDPAARPCTGRVAVAQRLLDDGHASPGTVAAELGKALEAELAGESFVGVGSFRRVADISVRWAEIAKHPMDMVLVGSAPHGYVRATARLVFDRLDVPLVIALAPRPGAAELRFEIAVRAELDLGNRVLQWISDRLGGDAFATRLAQRQVDEGLVAVLQPPPPLELPGGGTIAFGYCADPPEIVDGAWGALPFTVELGRAAGPPEVLPPRRGRAPRTPPAATADLSIDVDLDALNALLYELWRTGFLDRRLAEAGLDRRFNEDPIVAEFLSIRISPPRLALPPVVAPGGRGLRLLADARVTIADGAHTTTGRVWGGLDFAFAERAGEPVAVALGALELSCERPPATLVPCYADLVAAVRDRGDAFQGELTRVFAGLLAELFAGRRLEEPGFPAALVIHAAAPSLTTAPAGAAPGAAPQAPPNASLHLDLNAVLVPPR